MKATEIRNMTEAEIEQSLLSLKEKLFNLRAENTTGRLDRPNRLRDVKKDIARCLTILEEKKGELK